MRNVFQNSSKLQCVFNDEGITFYGAEQEVFLPYGCLDSVKISLLGVLQAACGKTICSFAVARKDRAAMKEAVLRAREAMKTAPKAEPEIIAVNKTAEAQIPRGLSPEEQLKHYQALFIQGAISKEAYDAKKRLLKN